MRSRVFTQPGPRTEVGSSPVAARYALMREVEISNPGVCFGEASARVCSRQSVRLVLVNPAYTSLIGRVKFAPRYGSSVHTAAALAIARRAMALSERPPSSGEGIPVLLASGDRVTLPRPARIARKHVWSSWRQLSDGLSAVHAGRRGGAPQSAIGRRERSRDLRRRRDGDRLAPRLLRTGVRFPRASEVDGLTSPPSDRPRGRREGADSTRKSDKPMS
jgi:hypothetical protein